MYDSSPAVRRRRCWQRAKKGDVLRGYLGVTGVKDGGDGVGYCGEGVLRALAEKWSKIIMSKSIKNKMGQSMHPPGGRKPVKVGGDHVLVAVGGLSRRRDAWIGQIIGSQAPISHSTLTVTVTVTTQSQQGHSHCHCHCHSRHAWIGQIIGSQAVSQSVKYL